MKARLGACVLSCVLLLIIQNVVNAHSPIPASGASNLQTAGNGGVEFEWDSQYESKSELPRAPTAGP